MIEQHLDHQRIGQDAPDAIRNEQEAITGMQLVIGKVHQHARIEADGA